MISSISLINKQEQRFRRLAFLTVIVVYLLVLAGGIVRGTGSGMGCPDWPRCFGRWIPPTEISQLPPNYQAIYGAKLKGEVEFNAVKTWIEYANRLLGIISGFLVFATLISSLSFLRKDITVFWGSVVAFLLIGANGWLGSRVVATELAQYMVTLHLLLAIALVFTLLFLLVRSSAIRIHTETVSRKAVSIRWLLLVVMVLTLGQVVFGTQVRDELDKIVKQLSYAQRENWVSNLDWSFYVHRSFSLIVLIFQVAVIYQLRILSKIGRLSVLTKSLVGLVVAEIGTGIIMAYLGVPAFAQPIHLVLAVLIVGLQFVSWLLVNPDLILPTYNKETSRLVEV